MAARSSGMFPKYATWVDAATIIPADGSTLNTTNLQHSAEVHVVAYFSPDAVGTVAVTLGSEVITLTAPAGGGKVVKVRSGYELGEVTSVTQSQTLTAGTCQVSLF